MSTLTAILLPYTTLFRSQPLSALFVARPAGRADQQYLPTVCEGRVEFDLHPARSCPADAGRDAELGSVRHAHGGRWRDSRSRLRIGRIFGRGLPAARPALALAPRLGATRYRRSAPASPARDRKSTRLNSSH